MVLGQLLFRLMIATLKMWILIGTVKLCGRTPLQRQWFTLAVALVWMLVLLYVLYRVVLVRSRFGTG